MDAESVHVLQREQVMPAMIENNICQKKMLLCCSLFAAFIQQEQNLMQRIHLDSCSANTSGHPILLRFTSLLVPETPMKKRINLHYSFSLHRCWFQKLQKEWIC